MNFKLSKTIGETTFVFADSAETHAQFFQKAGFYGDLPSVGPNGETDLKIVHRTNPDGNQYFSIDSVKADQSFEIGQKKKPEGDLFCKGWKPLYHKPGAGGNPQSSPTATPAQTEVPVTEGAKAEADDLLNEFLEG